MVGPTRFELVSIAPEATSLDQASRWPHDKSFFSAGAFYVFVGLALTLAVWRVEPALESIYKGGGRLGRAAKASGFLESPTRGLRKINYTLAVFAITFLWRNLATIQSTAVAMANIKKRQLEAPLKPTH